MVGAWLKLEKLIFRRWENGFVMIARYLPDLERARLKNYLCALYIYK
jgi:hypothetical protein